MGGGAIAPPPPAPLPPCPPPSSYGHALCIYLNDNFAPPPPDSARYVHVIFLVLQLNSTTFCVSLTISLSRTLGKRGYEKDMSCKRRLAGENAKQKEMVKSIAQFHYYWVANVPA